MAAKNPLLHKDNNADNQSVEKDIAILAELIIDDFLAIQELEHHAQKEYLH